jgi:hypothetical protein
VKYGDELVLLANGQTVLQGMVCRLVEVGRRFGIEMKVEMTKVMTVVSDKNYDRLKPAG